MVAEHAQTVRSKCKDFETFLPELISAGNDAVELTPSLLPVLKKAGVVDAGGQGLVYIMEGMLGIKATSSNIKKTASKYSDNDIEFTYCTEFIVMKNDTESDSTKLRAYLESIGDSVVVVDDDGIIKVHVHTEHPGKAIEKGITFGPLTNMKIENMKEQNKGGTAKKEMQSKKKLAKLF